MTGPVTVAAPEETDVGEEPSRLRLSRDLSFARVEAALLGEPKATVKIGRFVLVDLIGRGAMGVVYRAYDPKLDRAVAIKVVEPSRVGSEAGDSQVQLEREARASAVLSHPNVVTVYDVGQHAGNVFLAMEYVPGQTLEKWLDGPTRPWPKTLEMFAAVGRGLAAAHAHGITHRDFKPENVLVGEDGRPRVADFGLARPAQGWVARAAAGPSDSDIATTGSVCGTPAYMSPEQFAGVDVGPASDQFAFCVSLYEALFGERPFRATSLTDLAARVLEGTREPIPSDRRIPKPLLEVIERGLAPSVDDRHPDMETLVRKLERLIGRRRRRVMLSFGALLAGMAAASGYALAGDAPDPCPAQDSEFGPAWGEQRQASVRSALVAGGGDSAFVPVQEAFDDFVERWSAIRRDACEATRIRGEQSQEGHQLRVACLDRARAHVDGITFALSDGSQHREVDVLRLLPPVEDCNNLAFLERRYAGFADRSANTPEGAAAERRGTKLHAEAIARRAVDDPAWEGLAEELITLAEGHEHLNLLAQGLHLRAFARGDAGDFEAAAKAFSEALATSLRGGLDPEASLNALMLADTQINLGRHRQAEMNLLYGEALAVRAHDHYQLTMGLRWRPELVRGALALAQGDARAARDAFERAVAVLDHERPSGEEMAQAKTNLGIALSESGDRPAAVTAYEAALASYEELDVKPPLPLARLHNRLAVVKVTLREFDDAAAHIRTGLDLLERTGHEEHLAVSGLLLDKAWLDSERGELDTTQATLERALAIRIAKLGERHVMVGSVYFELGRTQRHRGEYGEAVKNFERAIAIRAAWFDAGHPQIGIAKGYLGRAQADGGDRARGESSVREAVAILSRDGVDAYDRAEAEITLAEVLVPGQERPELTSAAQGRIAHLGTDGDDLRERIDALRSPAYPRRDDR